MNISTLKERAKEFASHNKLNFWKPILVLSLISFLVSFLITILFGQESTLASLLSSLVSLALVPASVGSQAYNLKLVRGESPDVTDELQAPYKNFLPLILQSAVMGFFIALGSILLAVPGIIISLMLGQVTYILAEGKKEDLEGINALKKSKEMMAGHKMELFKIILGILGWSILCCLTLGILFIWKIPYFEALLTMYYEELKK